MTALLNPFVIGAGGGGGGGAPSSITHLVRPAAMTFSAGNLASVTDEIAASSTYFSVSGNLPGDSTNGYDMTEANNAYVALTGLFTAAFPSGNHLALRTKRNATPDTRTIAVGGTADTRYMYAADSGSTSTTTASGHAVAKYRVDGSDVSPLQRDQCWTDAFADTTERVILFKDVTEVGELRLLWYSNSTYRFEGTCGGWAKFTDWAQADAVATFLLGTDPV